MFWLYGGMFFKIRRLGGIGSSSLPHRQLRKLLIGTEGASNGSLPHRQLRNSPLEGFLPAEGFTAA